MEVCRAWEPGSWSLTGSRVELPEHVKRRLNLWARSGALVLYAL